MAVNGHKDRMSVDLLSMVDCAKLSNLRTVTFWHGLAGQQRTCQSKQSKNGNILAWACQARQDSRGHVKVINLRTANTLAWACQARQDSRGHAKVSNLRTVVTTWHALAQQGGVVQRGSW